jgi:hypothetical protein
MYAGAGIDRDDSVRMMKENKKSQKGLWWASPTGMSIGHQTAATLVAPLALFLPIRHYLLAPLSTSSTAGRRFQRVPY